MIRLNFLKFIKTCKFKFQSYKDNILQGVNKLWIYSFFKKKHEWINASLRNYALFLLWGSISLATIRFFQMWVTNSWHLINFYYTSVAFSFFVTFVFTSLRYFKDKGYFKRGQENSQKWINYKNYVADKHNLRWNFLFSRSIVILLPLDGIFHTLYAQSHGGELLTNVGMFTFTLVFFCYFINHCYLVHWIRKTQIPDELLLEPSGIFVKIASIPVIDKILSRKYSTRTRAERLRLFYSNNKKEVWSTGLGVATALWWANGGDNTIAGFTGETSYGARAYNSTTEGWFTTDPKLKRRAHSLSRWGSDPSMYCYEGSKRLDPNKLNSAYEAMRDEKCPSRHRMEVRDLKSTLESTRSTLEDTRLELERQAQANEALARRLDALERAKEVENR